MFLKNETTNKNYNRLRRDLKKKKTYFVLYLRKRYLIVLFFFLSTTRALLRLLKKCENLSNLKSKLFLLFVELLFYVNIDQ